MPQDITTRLLRYVNIADVISAWTINRHFLYKKTDSFTKRPYKVKTELDKQYYEKNKEMMTKFLGELEKARISNQDLISSLIDKSGGYSIPPWYLENETEPIEVWWSGFSCVLCTKDVNDRASFVNSYAHAEDYDFCTHARKLGFKVVVDPTCKCGHLGTEALDGNIPTDIWRGL